MVTNVYYIFVFIKKRKSQKDRHIYYVTIEDTYDIISKAHIATGHGGHDRMLKHLNPKYGNITTEAVELFKSYCIVCQEKRKRPKTTGVVVKPILSREFNSHGQVDLIDMQSAPQGRFKWIMVYQCHLIKFVILGLCPPRELLKLPFNCWTSSFYLGHQLFCRVIMGQNSQPMLSLSSKRCGLSL